MSRFETTFRNAIANAERDVLVDQIRANPQMSLNELGKLATGELGKLLNQITIADLIGAARKAGIGQTGSDKPEGARKASGPQKAADAARKPAQAESARPAKAEGAARKPAQADGRKPARAAAVDVDTRTAEGRSAYDEAVLAALRGATGPQSASELTAVAGGSPLQIRTALARLIEAGTVHWSGRARGTRYTAA